MVAVLDDGASAALRVWLCLFVRARACVRVCRRVWLCCALTTHPTHLELEREACGEGGVPRHCLALSNTSHANKQWGGFISSERDATLTCVCTRSPHPSPPLSPSPKHVRTRTCARTHTFSYTSQVQSVCVRVVANVWAALVRVKKKAIATKRRRAGVSGLQRRCIALTLFFRLGCIGRCVHRRRVLFHRCRAAGGVVRCGPCGFHRTLQLAFFLALPSPLPPASELRHKTQRTFL